MWIVQLEQPIMVAKVRASTWFYFTPQYRAALTLKGPGPDTKRNGNGKYSIALNEQRTALNE